MRDERGRFRCRVHPSDAWSTVRYPHHEHHAGGAGAWHKDRGHHPPDDRRGQLGKRSARRLDENAGRVGGTPRDECGCAAGDAVLKARDQRKMALGENPQDGASCAGRDLSQALW